MKILAISERQPHATPDMVAEHMPAEIARAKQFYLDGLIEQAYMDATYTQTFMIVEADDVSAVREQFDTYPQVAAGLITFTLIPLVGLPAVAEVEQDRGRPLPVWWPPE